MNTNSRAKFGVCMTFGLKVSQGAFLTLLLRLKCEDCVDQNNPNRIDFSPANWSSGNAFVSGAKGFRFKSQVG